MKSESENRDWLNEYMSLKQVNPNNPFTVPDGYFDSLEGQIMSYVKLEELKKNTPEENGFPLPANYFDELASNIQSRINIESFSDKEAESFTVPEGYFKNLSEQIQSRIFVEEAMDEAPEGFTVPQGYFEQLTANILDKTAEKQEAVVKQMQPVHRGVVRKLFASAAFKYASAACLVLAVGATLLLTQNNTTQAVAHNNTFLHKSLSAIPVDDIQNYLELHMDASDTRALIDESKQVDAQNLSNELQDALDSSQ
ncbi:MAG: hypothetical protein ACTHJ8_07220 [Mucilaginibacter sp.]